MLPAKGMGAPNTAPRREASLPAVRQVAWLEAGSGKVALSPPAHPYPAGA